MDNSSSVQLIGNAALPPTAVQARRMSWQSGRTDWGDRAVPEEVAIALTYNGSTHAVMMATPDDIEDFALGFSLNEGIITHAADISGLDIVSLPNGIDARIWLRHSSGQRHAQRRRSIAGPTGCGLCGIDSLNEVARAVPSVTSSLIISADDVAAAVAGLVANQRLHMQTRAVHGAAFWSPGHGLVALREDVGRHNALDKLAGALLSQDCKTADGLLVVTSRISVEMVQKAACIGAPILVAVSAPTALAVRVAEDAGITLITGARGNDFEIFTHANRASPIPTREACHK